MIKRQTIVQQNIVEITNNSARVVAIFAPCPRCRVALVSAIAGRKDEACPNCGFREGCC